MMENCCYDRVELMILKMVRQGLLGELLHAECGYLHDLRDIKFSDEGEGLWRLAHSEKRNGDLYPTHGLGAVAQCMNINRGNQFARLVSMSSPSRGLNLFAERKFGRESPEARKRYALGDVVTTLIQTTGGQTIVVQHDTDSPRPYSRDINVQGTRGLVRKYPEEKIYLEGRSPEHQWEPLSNYGPEFEHPLWKSMQERSEGAGHGRYGLHRGLPSDPMPAPGHAARHGRVRRRGLECRVPPERALHRQPEPTGPFPRFHSRPVEEEATSGHRHRLRVRCEPPVLSPLETPEDAGDGCRAGGNAPVQIGVRNRSRESSRVGAVKEWPGGLGTSSNRVDRFIRDVPDGVPSAQVFPPSRLIRA